MKLTDMAAKALRSSSKSTPQDDGTTTPIVDFLKKYPANHPLPALDAADMRSLFHAAYDWLARHYEEVNRMNVFPVPDGDTGTNLLLTSKAAWAAVATRRVETAGAVVAAAAEGAHRGSRGNSGVIFGQMLQGISQALGANVQITVVELAAALRRGSEHAYASVPTPIEGTILTVARAMGDAADAVAQTGGDMRDLFRRVVDTGHVTVQQTPELLPVLKKAGVVDSGGKGLFYIIEGMQRALTGEPVPNNGDAKLGDVVEAEVSHQVNKGHRPLPAVQWGFDVQFLVEQPTKSVAEILADIRAMGDYPLVEGDAQIVKVHVHVFDPGVPLSYGVSLGFVTDVVVENMDDMAATAQIGMEPAPVEAYSLRLETLAEGAIGVVAVAPGEGFMEIFHSLGVHGVVRGGQTMNPSVADLTEVIRRLPCKQVIVLPNNGNILLAAEQAAKLVHKEERRRHVAVLPSKSVPQGIAAMLAYDPSQEKLKKLTDAMADQMSRVQTGEVTQAVRDAELDGLTVQTGDVIGLHNGKLTAVGQGVADVVFDLLRQMVNDEVEIVTLYYGDFVAEHAAKNLVEQVQGVYPELDVELAAGGQPHYFYILSAE